MTSNVATKIRQRARKYVSRTRYLLRLSEPDPGPARLADAFRHPISERDRLSLVSTCRERFPESVEMELAEAARLMTHRFTFLGHTVDHGQRIAWSLDPVSGREWSRGLSFDIPYRGPNRLGDVKLPWELSKHQYFFTLGKAAWLAGDPSFAREVINQIDQWIEDNPYHRGVNWISALEVGVRAISWIMAYPFYAEHCDAGSRSRLARSLASHMMFIDAGLSTGAFANNHLIGEAAALVVGGLFLDCRQSRSWLEKGLAVFEEQMQRQVTSDGVHVERSPAYHRFVLDHYYLVGALLAANGRSLSSETLRGMERMTAFLMDVVAPDGRAPAFGDGDDARALWLRTESDSSCRSLLALGAVLFQRGDFKAAAHGLPEEVLWLLGVEGMERFLALPECVPNHGSVAYADGGYCVMRGGWSEPDPVLVFDCGPLGHGPAGHGHADALSFQLHTQGYTFLVDPGTFSYNLDYERRDVFRSTRAHNTVVVDGVNQSVPADRMSWKTAARSDLKRWVTTPWIDVADGEHDGYARLSDPVTHRRVIVFLKPDRWIMWDLLKAKERHSAEFLLHVAPDCAIDICPGAAGAFLVAPNGQRLKVSIPGAAADGRHFEVVECDEHHPWASFSPSYGTAVPSRVLRISSDFVGESGLVTYFSTSDDARPVVAQKDGLLTFNAIHNGFHDSLNYNVGSGVAESRDEDVRFDGALLFRRTMSGAPVAVVARDFRRISLAGVLEAGAQTTIDSLVYNQNRCEIVVDEAEASHLNVQVHRDVDLVVNGHSVVHSIYRHSARITS
jgi:hypothetical protein